MAEVLSPGVYVEETSFRSKSIEGVGTSVAAIVGPTRFGPLRGKPEVLTSFDEFRRVYGDASDLAFTNRVLNHTAIAARAFFDNGGRKLFVVRVVGGGKAWDPINRLGSAGTASSNVPAAAPGITFRSRFPGAGGNLVLELRWRDVASSVLRIVAKASPAAGSQVAITGEASAAAFAADPTNAPAAALQANEKVTFRAIATVMPRIAGETADRYTIVRAVALRNTPAAGSAAATTASFDLVGAVLKGDQLRNLAVQVAELRPSADGTTPKGAATLAFGNVEGVADLAGVASWGTSKLLRGLIKDDATFQVVSALNPGLATGDIDIPLLALAAAADQVGALLLLRTFDLDVRRGTGGALTGSNAGSGEIMQTVAGIRATKDEIEKALDVDGTSLVTASVTATTEAEVLSTLVALCDPSALRGDNLDGVRYLIPLQGGSDGDPPTSVDYAGEVDETLGNTGLAALEDIEDVSIVLTPAAVELDTDGHQLVVNEVLRHCRKMRYRMGLVDSRKDQTIGQVREFGSRFDDSRLALYYPWVVTSDPEGRTSGRKLVTVPPSGFVAGVYANTDITRGVHKAPANELVVGALRFERDINPFQQELLNPDGINCLCRPRGRGNRVWGARTLSRDPEWQYVNVRRYFLYLERSIDVSTQWIVFEPNGERLWENVRTTIEGFLYNEWREKRLLGGSPKDAYFVRCDRTTMTQNDLDNGRLICLVGVAPLRPAEFVIFRIGQKTADA